MMNSFKSVATTDDVVNDLLNSMCASDLKATNFMELTRIG